MPINRCQKGGKPGFKFGDSGTCYTYTSGDAKSRERAKNKAIAQERAAHASGFREKKG